MMSSLTTARAVLMGALLAAAGLGAPARAQAPGDGSEMVLVPEGRFSMGSPGKAVDEDGAERPVHEVSLPAFSVDKYEVTTAQYARFLNAVKRTADEAGRAYIGLNEYLPLEQGDGQWRPRKGVEKHPMLNVTWHGANAYARWAGKRLPTEAEWERAARGTDGRKFPWGSDMDRGKFRLGCDAMLPVGSHPAGVSPTGCLDMAGNAWEWTSSLFKPYPYDLADGREDANAAGRRVARGGSWEGEPHIAHCAYRFRPEPDFCHRYLGFRCAK